MRPAALAAFKPFTDELEGAVDFMYADILGLVTTGSGNLIDPMGIALALPWRHEATGELAAPDEVAIGWRAVKQRTDLCKRGGMAFRHITDLRLDDAALTALFDRRLAANEAILLHRFPDLGEWCCDAQLALHSMSWALGAAFRWPKFDAAALAQDFTTCAAECHIVNGAPARNAANRLMFENAAAVVREDYDPEVLFWPGEAC